MLCVSLGSAITDYKPDWVFCFAFKCFFSQCNFLKFFFGLSLQETEPVWDSSFGPSSLSTKHAQAIFPGSFPLGFSMALQWPNLRV